MEPLTQSYIKRLHALLTYGTYADRKHKIGTGEYRTKSASIGKKPACSPKDINKALGALINEYEEVKTPHTIEHVLDFHVRFEKIRPFDDYNGRIGRIIMMKECIRRGIDPFVIGDKNRSTYYRGLSEWDDIPDLLLGLIHDEQVLFSSKRELCKLMQYQRSPIR
jgi:Fic family protein